MLIWRYGAACSSFKLFAAPIAQDAAPGPMYCIIIGRKYVARGGKMAAQRCRTPTLSALWGSMSQSSAESHSESSSDRGGSGIIPPHRHDSREESEQSSRVASSDSSESEDDSVRLRSRMEQNCLPPCKKRKQSKLNY